MTIGAELRPAIIGPFGPAQLACLRSWNRLGLSPVFVQIQEGDWVIRPALKLAAHVSFTRSELATQAGSSRLMRFLHTERVSGITCLSDDMAIWLNALRPAMPTGTEVWLPDTRVIQFLASKSAQAELAREVGFGTLPTYFIDRTGGRLPDNVSFPLIARPDGPGTVIPSFKAEFIPDRRYLDEFLSRFERISCPLVLQPFIRGPNLVIHGYRAKAGRTTGCTGFEVIRKFEGLALTIRPCGLDHELQRHVEAFCNRIDIVGCYHFDLVVDHRSRQPYFLEMNGRLGGTTAKALACGYDEPASLLVAYGNLGRNVVDRSPSRRRCTNKMGLAKYLISLTAGRTTPLDYPGASLLKDIFGVVSETIFWRDEVFSLRDISSSFSYYLQTAAIKASSRRRSRVERTA